MVESPGGKLPGLFSFAGEPSFGADATVAALVAQCRMSSLRAATVGRPPRGARKSSLMKIAYLLN